VAAAAVVAMVVTAGPAGADPTPPPAGRGLAEVLGGTTTLGLSIPGETVSGGAATIGVIAGRAPRGWRFRRARSGIIITLAAWRRSFSCMAPFMVRGVGRVWLRFCVRRDMR